ncbi:hypothetical protein NE850_18105 [Paraburkholderia sp. USG1]|uniref:hypothetical protein n=1 Tax=Paraburkholderia sp. USG1 TaxID=2952268 RepID=UPI002863FADA|nr:hypothetical protein [Paraburkholderia sp. USG1]MDR8398258.1 hypothetical protein [Paraburkholderia sp. USG1]
MVNRIMSAQRREVCEFLMMYPGSTIADIVEGTCAPYDSIKKRLRALKASGHVKGSESSYRSSYQLTGKPFPRVADYQPNARYAASKASRESRDAIVGGLCAAMHAMVMRGRASA